MFTISQLNQKLRQRAVTFGRDERGLTTVEYVIVLVLVAIGGIGLWTTFGSNVNQKIKDSNESMSDMAATNTK